METITPGTYVIFLDFDGVLLTARTLFADGTSFSKADSDPCLVKVLRRCCDNGARIVVSSTWREFGEIAIEKLKDCCLWDYVLTDWATPAIRAKQAMDDRPQEIADYLFRHPEITSYVILDDDEWHWTPEQRERWIPSCSHDGVGYMGLQRLLEWAGVIPKKPQILAE